MKTIAKKMMSLCIPIWLLSCDTMDTKLKIINNGHSPITYVFSLDSVLDCSKGIKSEIKDDTLTVINKEKALYYIGDTISAGNIRTIVIINKSKYWEKTIKRSSNLKLNVFFTSSTNLVNLKNGPNLPCDVQFKHKSYTLEELKRNNWIISYE